MIHFIEFGVKLYNFFHQILGLGPTNYPVISKRKSKYSISQTIFFAYTLRKVSDADTPSTRRRCWAPISRSYSKQGMICLKLVWCFYKDSQSFVIVSSRCFIYKFRLSPLENLITISEAILLVNELCSIVMRIFMVYLGFAVRFLC